MEKGLMEISQPPITLDYADLNLDLRQRLKRRIHWIHVMRWIGVVAAIVGMAVGAWVLKLSLNVAHISAVIACLVASNIVYTYKNLSYDPVKTDIGIYEGLIYTEIITDYLLLTALMHLCGGIPTLFPIYYGIHIVIASLLVPRSIGYYLAGCATILVGTVAFGEMTGVLGRAHVGGDIFGGVTRDPLFVAYYMCAYSSVFFILAYISSQLRLMLQRRERFLTELKERLEQWNLQIRVANERLSEIDRTKTRFMRMSGHEIRSPLSAMLSIMRTILEGYVKDEGKILEMIGIANRRANEALEIANMLLQLAKEKGKDLAPEQFDLMEEVARIVSDMKEQMDENQVAVDIAKGREDSLVVNVDRESFMVAMENILSNAVKYSYPEGRVEVQVERWRDKAMVFVVDRGIGIPEEFMTEIFEEFSRAPNARTHVRSGTGLGMPIVRQAAVNMGGSVTVRSIGGQGTVVRLTIPVGAAEWQI